MTQSLLLPDAALGAMEPSQAAHTFIQHAAEARASDLFFLTEGDHVAHFVQPRPRELRSVR